MVVFFPAVRNSIPDYAFSSRRRFCSPSNHFPLPPPFPSSPPLPRYPLPSRSLLFLASRSTLGHGAFNAILFVCKYYFSASRYVATPVHSLKSLFFSSHFLLFRLLFSSHSCPDTTQQRARPYFNPNTVSANSSPWRITNLRLSRTISHPAFLRHHHHLISSCQPSRKEANVLF